MQPDQDAKLKALEILDAVSMFEGLVVSEFLTARQENFCIEYMRTGNPGQSYKKAYNCAPTTSERSLRACGNKLLQHEKIRARIDALRDMVASDQLEGKKELMRFWRNIVRSDVNELSSVLRGCCRYCHGKGGAYQYLDRDEYAMACLVEAADAKRLNRDIQPIEDKGGYDFDLTRLPNPDCLKCRGFGIARVEVWDTTTMSDEAKDLYKGAEPLRGGGIKVHTQDKQRASECIARVLGIFNDKVAVTNKNSTTSIPDELTDAQSSQMYQDNMD